MTKLNDWFYYDATSRSCLRWKQNRYTGNPKRILVAKDDPVGNYCEDGYHETSLDGKGYMVHRIIWELFNGKIPEGLIIDHKDGDPSNNRIENLKLVTWQGNARNSRMRSHNTTGYTGVAKTKKICKSSGKVYFYYTALWKTLEGEQQTANYSIEKLGDGTAFLLAFTHRQCAMEDLASQGAGYSKRHGL